MAFTIHEYLYVDVEWVKWRTSFRMEVLSVYLSDLSKKNDFFSYNCYHIMHKLLSVSFQLTFSYMDSYFHHKLSSAFFSAFASWIFITKQKNEQEEKSFMIWRDPWLNVQTFFPGKHLCQWNLLFFRCILWGFL